MISWDYRSSRNLASQLSVLHAECGPQALAIPIRSLGDDETPSRNSQRLALVAILLHNELQFDWSFREIGSFFRFEKNMIYRVRSKAVTMKHCIYFAKTSTLPEVSRWTWALTVGNCIPIFRFLSAHPVPYE
jgi:hypothetical protein